MLILKRDGTLEKTRKTFNDVINDFNVIAVIKQPDCKPNPDSAFIHSLSKKNGKKMGIDDSLLDKDNFIDNVINSHSTRVVLARTKNNLFEYVCFTYLDDFTYGLRASIHGMIRTHDFMGNKTNKYLKLFRKYKIFDILIDDYFKAYDNHEILNIESIEVYLPDFLKEKKIYNKDTRNHDRVDLPTAKMLISAGFKCITKYPQRNACWKNGKSRDLFIYQLHKKWWERNKGIVYSN